LSFVYISRIVSLVGITTPLTIFGRDLPRDDLQQCSSGLRRSSFVIILCIPNGRGELNAESINMLSSMNVWALCQSTWRLHPRSVLCFIAALWAECFIRGIALWRDIVTSWVVSRRSRIPRAEGVRKCRWGRVAPTLLAHLRYERLWSKVSIGSMDWLASVYG
jgi:hypothetical protein